MSGNLLNVVAKTIIKVDDEADDKKLTKNKRLNLQALALKRIYSQFVLVKRMTTPVFEMPSITPQKKKSQSLKMIPSDLINMMIDHVNLRDAINLRVTCKYFNKAISNLGPHVYRRVNVGDTYIVRNNKGEIHNKMKIFVGCIYHKTGTSIYLLFSDHKFTSVEEIFIKNLEKRICFGSDISLKSIGHQRAQFPCTGNAKFPRPVLVHNFTPGRKLTIEKFPDVLDEKSARDHDAFVVSKTILLVESGPIFISWIDLLKIYPEHWKKNSGKPDEIYKQIINSITVERNMFEEFLDFLDVPELVDH